MFDINVKLGHWPYRPVKGLADLLRLMDAHGVEQAAVSSLNAVHYLNPQDGNEDLVRAIEGHRDRLIPFAAIRPNFAGWMDDLSRCLDEYGMKGILLYPDYHRFSLMDAPLSELVDAAVERDAPICIQAGLEDVRRQFDRVPIHEVPVKDIGGFARAHPRATVIALGLKFGQPDAVGVPLPGNFYFDTSNYETVGDLEYAVATFGADRILFGSNFPLFNMSANVEKLRRAELSEDDRTAVAKGNALRIMRQTLRVGPVTGL